MLQNPEKEGEKLSIAKDSEVEVTSKEEGFIGAWYRAILEEKPTKSRRKKLRVRYTTLFQDDYSTPLTETVEQSFIRPVPPEDLYDGVVFEEGSVVDGDLKDGWWNGVVVKKMEDDQFWVYFDSPPDIIQFDRKQLRPHLDWTGSEWVRTEIKELSKSLFSSGTMVEVSRKIDKVEAGWVPALVIKEIGKKRLIVKPCDKSLTFTADEVNFTVDLCNVRPIPPPSFVEEFKLLDRVDIFHGSVWRQGLVRGVLSGKRYSVSFVATKEESVFKQSDLRHSKEWENGVWHQGQKRKPVKETPSDGKRKISVTMETTLREINALCRSKKMKIIRSTTAAKQITHARKSPKRTRKHTRKSTNPAEDAESATEGETELHETVAAMEFSLAQESGNQMAGDDIMNGAATPFVTPQVIPIEKESAPPETSVINEAETQGMASPEKTLQSMRVKFGLGVGSTEEKTSEEHDINENSHKRKREQKHDSNLKETELSPDRTPNAVKNSAADETRANENTSMVMPFVKHSPIWVALESMEVFKTLKQCPHFIPLLETREEFREGSAVGEIVKFSSLLERVRNLHLDTPKSTLEGLKECFFELEKYGFNVTSPILRIDMLFTLKDKQVNTEDKLKDNEKEMTEEVSKLERVEESLRDVERKILELQSQEADLKEKKDASEKKIAQMQLYGEDLDKKIQDVELEFQTIVSAPW
ncbi:hypothetical protein EUTSA_v10001340mg [Eutrema salsugineum]|uniref:Agenet domain-containing protein n=1 Tax=Eutrema salsugineum TaxID=72664 RepID=V4L6R7_EUTSA|nr:DUF724 domain-containing protein 6 [Eutrema salsugineum]ESQ39369.1 hypothetical protein EUTSA_v10001340mg [Eutrema salsugineum]